MLDPEVRHRTLQLLGIEVRKYNPAQPRDPGGEDGGRWVKNPAAEAKKIAKAIEGATDGDGGSPPKPWAAAAAGQYHDDLADVQDLVDAINSGEVGEPTRLSGGEMGSVERVEHANGKVLIHKILHDVKDVMGAEEGDPVRQADAEQLGSRLGQALGAPVPRVLRTDDDEIWMDEAEGEDLGKFERRLRDDKGGVYAWKATMQMYDALRRTDEGFRLGVFDLLTGNWDRNKYNNVVISPNGTPIGIDHSFLWGGSEDPDPRVPPSGAGGILSPFAQRFATADANGALVWADNPLTPEDIDWLRDRLAEVKPDFEAADRLAWWQFALDRLEAIAPHAIGLYPRLSDD